MINQELLEELSLLAMSVLIAFSVFILLIILHIEIARQGPDNAQSTDRSTTAFPGRRSRGLQIDNRTENESRHRRPNEETVKVIPSRRHVPQISPEASISPRRLSFNGSYNRDAYHDYSSLTRQLQLAREWQELQQLRRNVPARDEERRTGLVSSQVRRPMVILSLKQRISRVFENIEIDPSHGLHWRPRLARPRRNFSG